MTGNCIKVLLIDDDASYASILKHSLQAFQSYTFEMLWESNGDRSIEKLKSDKSINVILIDYYLSNENGIEVTKKILEEKIDIPIIFLTSNNDYRAAIEAMKQGVEDYLLKEEIKDNLLQRTILNVLSRFTLKKQIAQAEKEKLLSQKKNEAIKELVVTMCHEFNNPLAAIKISTAILAKQQISDTEKDLLNQLNNSATALEDQINRLRNLNIDKEPI